MSSGTKIEWTDEVIAGDRSCGTSAFRSRRRGPSPSTIGRRRAEPGGESGLPVLTKESLPPTEES